MHILITGGAGFIGSHTADALLARGDSVHILDDLSTGKRDNIPANASVTQGDVADDALVATLAENADAIIHLAAIASVPACEANWIHAHRTNAFGSVSVLHAAAKSAKKPCVVYASSAAIYGDNGALPLKETEIPRPISVYGMDKYVSEREAEIAHARFGVNSVGLRFFNVYGPRQDPKSPYSGVISIFAEAARANRGIRFFGDGSQTRDFIFVGDIVQLILASLAAPAGTHIANGCTGQSTSLLELAQNLRNITNTSLPAACSPARTGDIAHSLGCPAHAKQLLGFSAATSLKNGLTALLTTGNL